jgi:hypothetical protein
MWESAMKRLTWRDKAIRSIANALLEYEAQCLLMGESEESATQEDEVNPMKRSPVFL